jgi:hypothetical protein
MNRIFLGLAVLFSCAFGASAQAVRVDLTATTTINNSGPGFLPPLLAIPQAQVTICNAPASGSPCNNYATTYTDATGGMTCPTSQPIVLAMIPGCTSSADNNGRFGFWLAAGNYVYSISSPAGVQYGTYPLTVGGSGGGGPSYVFSPPLSLSSSTVSLLQANATTNGFLGSSDWQTFSAKQNSGITGDVSVSGTTATLAAVGPHVTNCGDATHSCQITTDTKGRVTGATSVSITGGGGGSSGNATSIQSIPVSSTAPTDTQILQYSAGSNSYSPVTLALGNNWSAGVVASLPATCTPGTGNYKYFATDQPQGQQDYSCTASNTWTQDQQLGGSGALAYTNGVLDIVTAVIPRKGASDTITGAWTFSNTITLTNAVCSGTCTGFTSGSPTQLVDTNGFAALKTTAAASAVNQLTVFDAVSGVPPTLAATGSDANIGLRLEGQGTGSVYLNAGGSALVTSTGSEILPGSSQASYFTESSGPPTLTAGTAAGSSPSKYIGGTAQHGYLWITTGSSGEAVGQFFTLTWSGVTFASGGPFCTLTPAGTSGSPPQSSIYFLYVSYGNSNSLTVSIADAPAASTKYEIEYSCGG